MRDLSIPPRWGAVAADMAKRQGWDAATILMEAQVSPRFLAGEPTPFSREQVRNIVRTVIALAEEESLGISDIPIPRGTTKLLLFSLASSETVGAAIARWSAFREAVPSVPDVTVVRSRDHAVISLDVSALRLPDLTLTQWLLAVIWRMMAWLTMREINVHGIQLPHPLPEGHSGYSGIFQAPAEFDCGAAVLLVDGSHVDAPILRTEGEITTILDRTDELLLGKPQHRRLLPDRVRRVVKAAIGQHIPTAGEIAATLNMTTSALQRSLRNEFDTSVREIRDITLCAEAVESLTGGAESLANLSSRLGFSEVSAFTRAFRRWTGESPAHYRDSARSVK